MIYATERAKEVLLRKIAAAKMEDPRIGLRLTTDVGGDVTLVMDRPKAGDEVLTHNDSTVLMVDPEVSAFVLAGRIIDCRRTPGGRLELVLTRQRFRGRVDDLDDRTPGPAAA